VLPVHRYACLPLLLWRRAVVLHMEEDDGDKFILCMYDLLLTVRPWGWLRPVSSRVRGEERRGERREELPSFSLA
jgi:hypothetical protein